MIKFYTGLIFFSIFSLVLLGWFLIESYLLFAHLISHQPYINFNKGAMYLLGGSICLLILLWLTFYTSVLKKTLTERLNKFYTRLFLASLVMTFALPQLVHYPLESYLQNQEYVTCPELSHRWLHAQTIVYGQSSLNCSPAEFENRKN